MKTGRKKLHFIFESLTGSVQFTAAWCWRRHLLSCCDGNMCFGWFYIYYVKQLLRVLYGNITVRYPLQPAAPPLRVPSLSVKQGQGQQSSSQGKHYSTGGDREYLTVPSCGKRLNETGIIKPRTNATLMWRRGATSRGFLWKSLVLWRKIDTLKSNGAIWSRSTELHLKATDLRESKTTRLGRAAVVPNIAALDNAVSLTAWTKKKRKIHLNAASFQ